MFLFALWSCLKEDQASPRWLSNKESACNAGDPGLIPGSGRSAGGGYGNPLQCSCLENPMYRGAWWAVINRVAKSQTQLKGLSRAQSRPLSGKLPLWPYKIWDFFKHMEDK